MIELSLNLVQSWIPARDPNAHKGLFGHVLVIGGNKGMPGSVRLAAEGAARIGAGRVTVVTRKEHVTSVISGRPELMCYGLEFHLARLKSLIEQASMIVLGPGLGQDLWSKRLFNSVLNANPDCLLLIDADGLNWLAKLKAQYLTRNNWILTPHPGEAARLLACSTEEIQNNRQKSIQLLQEQYGGIIVLKGNHSLIATEQQSIHCCTAGNPGMASPGMGDLLTGIIAGLVAQGLTPWQAANAGVLLHATAGDRLAERQGERGLLASDLLQELPSLVNHLSTTH